MWTQAKDGAIALAILLTLPGDAMPREAVMASTESMGRAQYNWIMHCQGCHGANAQGTPGGAPALVGNVARFLQIKAGRAYLGRVPGVAFVNLSDVEVADLLNWVVQRFDREHVPKTFPPYSEEEIRTLRREPLISDAYRERARLLQSLSQRQQLPSAQ
jgi:mono/diheme cytochrome c family protein